MSRPITSILAIGAVLLSALPGCKRGGQGPESPTEVLAAFRATLPGTPDDPGWEGTPVHRAALLLQDMVEPRMMKPSTATVDVQAATDGHRVAFRLRWADPTRNDLPGSARFADACAVQLPVKGAQDVPNPQMGEAGKPVQISYWSAFWQSTVDGRADTIAAIYPGARVDHYPFEAAPLALGSGEQKAMAQRYAPARALGNLMAGPRSQPVQDLLAEGAGTLRPNPATLSAGGGKHDGKSWSVVFVRPLPEGALVRGMSQVAVAVWQGESSEVGARKMRSAWIPLTLEAQKK